MVRARFFPYLPVTKCIGFIALDRSCSSFPSVRGPGVVDAFIRNRCHRLDCPVSSVSVPSRSRSDLAKHPTIAAMHGLYAATCASIAVSGVEDLDGTYDLDSSYSEPYYFRFGGNTNYEVYQDLSFGAWFMLDDETSVGLRVSHAVRSSTAIPAFAASCLELCLLVLCKASEPWPSVVVAESVVRPCAIEDIGITLGGS